MDKKQKQLEKICSFEQLKSLVNEHKAVIVPKSTCWNKPISASFVLHQQGKIILDLFNIGMYVYEKPKNVRKTIWQNGCKRQAQSYKG